MNDLKKRLARLLIEKSYKEGSFVLASGRSSDYYFDCRQTALHPEGAWLIGDLFLDMLADADVLCLVEPTSAVDAHTEARIAPRLVAHRAGRTTVVATASPLILHSADEVALLAEGRVVARGSHVELLSRPDYRQVVARGMDGE